MLIRGAFFPIRLRDDLPKAINRHLVLVHEVFDLLHAHLIHHAIFLHRVRLLRTSPRGREGDQTRRLCRQRRHAVMDAVPGDGGLLQVVVAIAGLGNRADGLRRVVFGVAYPGHQVAAGTDDQLADVVEQLDFIVVANQGQIAFTDQAQRPVEALLFGQRFLAFGNVGSKALQVQFIFIIDFF